MKIIWLRRYTKMVLGFSTVLALLYVVIMVYGVLRLNDPLVTTLDEFSYEIAVSEQLQFGLSDDHQVMFRQLTQVEFDKKPHFYHRIASEDQERYVMNRIMQSGIYLLLYVFVFIVHLALWQQIRPMKY